MAFTLDEDDEDDGMIRRDKLNGVTFVNKFPGIVRSFDNPGLEEGDTFTIEKGYKIGQQPVRCSDNVAYFTYVTLQNGTVKKFYPTCLVKTVILYDKDMNCIEKDGVAVRVTSGGAAAEEFRKHTTIQEAVDALVGKPMKVTKVDIVRTLSYDRKSLRSTQILTIDFVEPQ